eukprot:15173_1
MKICTKQWMDGSYRTGSSLRFYRHATCFLGRMAKMTIPILVPSKQHQYNRKPISYNARLRKDKGPLFYDKNGQIYSLLIGIYHLQWTRILGPKMIPLVAHRFNQNQLDQQRIINHQ